MTDPRPPTAPPRTIPWPWLLALLAGVFLAQLPLVFNAGYFSHDELQWAAHAGEAGTPLRWFAWTAFDVFQYRPLTFNLWLALSRLWFDQPFVFHAIVVAWGALNAMLLALLGIRLGMPARLAAAGAFAFAMGPFATFVHGWVGTLADLVWLSCALAIGLVATSTQRTVVVAVVAATLTLLGLLGKEAAAAIPALLVLAWWFDGRRRTWMAAAIASGVVVAAWLALRFGALVDAPRTGDQYTLRLAHMPLRWIEYQLFPPIPTILESFTTLSSGIGKRIALSALLWCALLAALWRGGRRPALVFLLGGIAALMPVLPLGSSWNHYGYGFAAVTAMAVASAWPRAPAWGRGVIAAYAALALLHGIFIMLAIHRVGTIQSVFSPALARHVGPATEAAPLRLRIAPDAKDWVFRRLTHEIPSYDGVPIGNRVRIVPAGEPADFLVRPDGSLVPVR